MGGYKSRLRLGKLDWESILVEELLKKGVNARKEGGVIMTDSSEVRM